MPAKLCNDLVHIISVLGAYFKLQIKKTQSLQAAGQDNECRTLLLSVAGCGQMHKTASRGNLTYTMQTGEGALASAVRVKLAESDGQSSSPKNEEVYMTVSPFVMPAFAALPDASCATGQALTWFVWKE